MTAVLQQRFRKVEWRNRVPVRTDRGIAEHGKQPLFNTRRDRMFQHAGLDPDFFPSHAEYLNEKTFR